MTTTTRQRKQRSDKGLVMATDRDLHVITWIAEQYAAHFDQVQQLLTREPGAALKGPVISESVVKDQISRWKRAGWVEYKRVLADGRGFAWPTRRGLALVELDEVFTAREPAATRLTHIYAVNVVRLRLEQKYAWKSEREIRSELEKGDTGPIPDGIITHPSAGRVAIEVELTAKKPADMVDKLVHLVRASYYSNEPGIYGLQQTYPVVWFYTPTEKIKRAIEKAREHLTQDEQPRVYAVVAPNLTP